MKTFLPLSKAAIRAFLTILWFAPVYFVNAQSGSGGGSSVPELVFKDPQLESGKSGADGATYRFKQVTNDVDAIMRIERRSSSQVRITDIDLKNTGYDNAFQPRISYNNGSAPSNRNWWIEFSMNFVKKGSTTPATVKTFKLTALDIDGDDNRLREYVSFYGAHSYTLERNTSLTVTNLLDQILGLLTPGIEFKGPARDYSNVSTSATNLMTTMTYSKKSGFTFRAGATTGSGSSNSTDRMYSFWFRGFDYDVPTDVTLPVKLVSFSAMLNDNDAVDLKWTTASEKNVSHFEVERSHDGKNYSKAGIVFAFGNTSEEVKYAFTDKGINANDPGVIYYRLRSIDNDGTSELSHVRSIRIGKKEEQLRIVAYPNPVVNELRVTIPSHWQGKKVSYELYSNNGQMLFQSVSAMGSQTETIDISRFAAGNYIVKASCGDETAHQKIIRK